MLVITNLVLNAFKVKGIKNHFLKNIFRKHSYKKYILRNIKIPYFYYILKSASKFH